MSAGPNRFQRLIHRVLMLQPVSACLSVVLQPVDTFFLRLTRRRHTITEIVGLPILQLTTVGAKTRRRRTSLLVALQDGDKFAVIATSFGRARNPGWYYNLKANPECQIVWKGTARTYLAREAEGEERAKYWQLGCSYYGGYERYRARAAPRRIPVMVMEPKNNCHIS